MDHLGLDSASLMKLYINFESSKFFRTKPDTYSALTTFMFESVKNISEGLPHRLHKEPLNCCAACRRDCFPLFSFSVFLTLKRIETVSTKENKICETALDRVRTQPSVMN